MDDQHHKSRALIDIIPRFESQSASEHAYNAVASLDRLKDDGKLFFSHDSSQLKRWERGCNKLKAHVNTLRSLGSDDMPEAFRQFIRDFEHDSERMFQMIRDLDSDTQPGSSVDSVMAWLAFSYQLSTYAIVASYVKRDDPTGRIDIQFDSKTGAVKDKWRMPRFVVPRRLRKFIRKIH